MADNSGTHTLIYNYLERLNNLLRAEERKISTEYKLQPIQLQMLNYLDMCNRYSNSPAGVTEYFQLTKGTVSQSLKVLEARDYISKQADTEDKRQVHLLVTSTGKALLAKEIPPTVFQETCRQLDASDAEQIKMSLRLLLLSLQRANNLRVFGVCHSCRYHQVEGAGQFRCGLTREVLMEEETGLICREYID